MLTVWQAASLSPQTSRSRLCCVVNSVNLEMTRSSGTGLAQTCLRLGQVTLDSTHTLRGDLCKSSATWPHKLICYQVLLHDARSQSRQLSLACMKLRTARIGQADQEADEGMLWLFSQHTRMLLHRGFRVPPAMLFSESPQAACVIYIV